MVRLPVAPVNLLVGAFLLHDKDQHAHVQYIVQLIRRQLGIVFHDKLHGVSSEFFSYYTAMNAKSKTGNASPAKGDVPP